MTICKTNWGTSADFLSRQDLNKGLLVIEEHAYVVKSEQLVFVKDWLRLKSWWQKDTYCSICWSHRCDQSTGLCFYNLTEYNAVSSQGSTCLYNNLHQWRGFQCRIWPMLECLDHNMEMVKTAGTKKPEERNSCVGHSEHIRKHELQNWIDNGCPVLRRCLDLPNVSSFWWFWFNIIAQKYVQ